MMATPLPPARARAHTCTHICVHTKTQTHAYRHARTNTHHIQGKQPAFICTCSWALPPSTQRAPPPCHCWGGLCHRACAHAATGSRMERAARMRLAVEKKACLAMGKMVLCVCELRHVNSRSASLRVGKPSRRGWDTLHVLSVHVAFQAASNQRSSLQGR